MNDLISRQAEIDALEAQERQREAQKRRYTFGNDEFSLEAAYHDCKLVFDGITDDDSFQEADTGLILYYANEIIYALHEALDKDTNVLSSDCISRQAAFDEIARWKGYLDEDMIERIQIGLKKLPSAQPEPIRINLNEPIKVKLTDWGKEIYYHQYDWTNRIVGREICKPKFPKEDENGYTEFQLWCFIELYGEHMGMIKPNVIDPLEIVYEG